MVKCDENCAALCLMISDKNFKLFMQVEFYIKSIFAVKRFHAFFNLLKIE